MTPAGLLFAVVGASLGCLASQNRKEKDREKQKSFDTFVKTGMKDKNFYLLSWRAERLAEKQRRELIRLRTNANFTAWASCPNCTVVDCHSILEIVSGDQCHRQCNQCMFKWRQG